ncbi:c-type cytochrome [Paludibacterium yongneupense]|uniref:c-type cytochrome n=1 Tax=Paludibacterium yongneupense TaxID=400061 RepID=UPI0004070BF3|nr:c-type cytochrome [Paludibacterium yongneupense]
MKRKMLLAMASAALAGTVLAQGTTDIGDAAQGKLLADKVCAACHGVDGNSVASINPSLAGQHPAYLYNQLKSMKSQARVNPVMSGILSTLNDNDLRNAAAYFAAQKPLPREAADKTQLVAGQKLFRAGNAVTHVPACMACHGPSGAGIPDQFPRLGSQQAAYIAKQLGDFKAGTRKGPDGKPSQMNDIAARLSDSEMKAVSEYISGLR